MATKLSKNLIVNYLPQHMTERELYCMFVTIGPIANCKVMKDMKTGYSYGYGFVNFVRPEDAERAIQQLNGLECFNKRIKVSFARPNGEDLRDTNLYITNLPRHFTEDDLENLFNPYGSIVQKHLLVDKITGMKRGVGFVRYDRREEAQEAIHNLDGKVMDGCFEALSVRIAEDHGKQRAAYFAGLQAGLSQGRGGRLGLSRGSRGGHTRGNLALSRNEGVNGSQVCANDVFHHNFPSSQRSADNFGAIRQGKLPQRYNPFSLDLQYN